MIARGLTLLAVAWLARLVHEQRDTVERLRTRVTLLEAPGPRDEIVSLIDERIAHPDNVRAVSRGIAQRTSMVAARPETPWWLKR